MVAVQTFALLTQSSVEPFMKGTAASTAFCLLFKLWTQRLTVKQIEGIIDHTDSP
jgi:pre-mRNA-splicing factor 38B